MNTFVSTNDIAGYALGILTVKGEIFLDRIHGEYRTMCRELFAGRYARDFLRVSNRVS